MGRLMLLMILVALGIHFFWWLPQKWQACGTLYDNAFAQAMCFAKGDN